MGLWEKIKDTFIYEEEEENTNKEEQEEIKKEVIQVEIKAPIESEEEKKDYKVFFDEKDFERTKKKLYGRMIMGMNDIDSLANNMAVSFFAGEDVFTDFETYKTVTVEDIRELLNKTLDENYSTLSVILPNS